MPLLMTSGAMMACNFGSAPSALGVLPIHRVSAGGELAATVMDHVPMVNIMPFGMCSSPSNPTVIAASVAALGVPTPMPCFPATPAPWVPGVPITLVGDMPALDVGCRLMCAWAGVIEFTAPGQATVEV